MGIDRGEEDDSPEHGDRPSHRPDSDGDAAPLLDPVERAAAHARYRATVERVCPPAREAWAEAIPGLHATWEKHEERYPERARATPRTQPDGSWVADGDRKLNPEQNAETSKACTEMREEGRGVVLPAMRRVEAADQERHLAGLENMFKSEDRLKEKVADELNAKSWLTIGRAMGTVADPVRFTFSYGTERYAEGVRADVERLKAEGFELMKLKNLWTDDQYKGINSQWRRPETGLRFEIQFHTPESLEAKELTHKAYERLRSPQTTPAERRELEDFQRRANALIITPAGTSEIKDFPEKRK